MNRDGPCYYCGEPTQSLAGDPGRWPLLFSHDDDPGVVRHHHTRCVYRLLPEANPQTVRREGLLKAIAALTIGLDGRTIRNGQPHIELFECRGVGSWSVPLDPSGLPVVSDELWAALKKGTA